MAQPLCLAFPPDDSITSPAGVEAILEFHPSEDTTLHQACVAFQPPAGYWKIGLLVSDLDAHRRELLDRGLEVTQPRQFRDIGYLCHTCDPDGYRIEFLQRTFASSPQKSKDARASLGHITLRAVDIDASLAFYREVLGMRLLSVQPVEPHEFTLYFLANTPEEPPLADLHDVRNRQWLWQRRYTCLEIQHFWGSQARKSPYQRFDTQSHGFWGLGFVASALQDWEKTSRAMRDQLGNTESLDDDAVIIRDPDGYLVRVTERQ